jgi:predicted DNA-binding transcriptional regulator
MTKYSKLRIISSVEDTSEERGCSLIPIDDRPPKDEEQSRDSSGTDALTGTTLRVYRLLFRERRPLGIHDIQNQLKLSSPSVAHYHVTKLLASGLIHEEGGGYVVNRMVFENAIRFRSVVIPFQAATLSFLGAALVVLLTVFRQPQITGLYFFSLVVVSVAFAATLYEVVRTFQRPL